MLWRLVFRPYSPQQSKCNLNLIDSPGFFVWFGLDFVYSSKKDPVCGQKSYPERTPSESLFPSSLWGVCEGYSVQSGLLVTPMWTASVQAHLSHGEEVPHSSVRIHTLSCWGRGNGWLCPAWVWIHMQWSNARAQLPAETSDACIYCLVYRGMHPIIFFTEKHQQLISDMLCPLEITNLRLAGRWSKVTLFYKHISIVAKTSLWEEQISTKLQTSRRADNQELLICQQHKHSLFPVKTHVKKTWT